MDGTGTIWGPLAGALLLEPLAEVTRSIVRNPPGFLEFIEGSSGVDVMLFGVLLIIFVLFVPIGVIGLFPQLATRRGQMAGTLSGGEQQMLAIGRALMSEPRVLMLDEPSLGLAPILVEGIFDVIQEIHSEGNTVLIVEQNAVQTLTMADRGYVLENGRIELSGTGAELLQDDRIRTAYLGL